MSRTNVMLLGTTIPLRSTIRQANTVGYCLGTDLVAPCMKACISSRVRRPSLLASMALKIRS
jgi:hypothetical protein